MDSAPEVHVFPAEADVRVIDWRSLYEDGDVTPPDEFDELGIRGVILDASGLADWVDGEYRGSTSSSAYDERAAERLCELQDAGFATDVVVGAPQWANDGHRYLVDRLVQHIEMNEYWQRCPPEVVYLDIEPYADGADVALAFDDLAATIESVVARDPRIRLGVFLPAWSPGVEAVDSSGDTPFERIVAALRPDDVVAGMTYRREIEGENGLISVVEQLGHELGLIRDDVGFVAGIETDVVDEPGISFADSSDADVVAAITDLVVARGDRGSFDAVFLNSLESYINLREK